MKTVFVSGCFDILHAGHIEFLRDARRLGDRLIVSVASAESLWVHKRRRPSLPTEHKQAILKSIRYVDEVVIGNGRPGIDFEEHFLKLAPQILAVTEDDRYEKLKRELCARVGAVYAVLPKQSHLPSISTAGLIENIKRPAELPLRVDFAGGWLDVPRFSRQGTFICNCAISPTVSIEQWPYETTSGLGGSAAWAILNGHDPVKSEIELDVGWQDPAVILEGGCCVWRSGKLPSLYLKNDGAFLKGRMAVEWSGRHHGTPGLADNERDYELIATAGQIALEAVERQDIQQLSIAINKSHDAQTGEGMEPIETGCDHILASKYCGGGWGGYLLHLFESETSRNAWVETISGTAMVEPFNWHW